MLMPRTSQNRLLILDSRHSFSRSSFSKGLWTGLVVMAAVLASRRMSGMLSSELSDLTVSVVATLAVFASLLAYVLYWSEVAPVRQKTPYFLLGVVVLIPPFAIAMALKPVPGAVAASYLVSLFLVSATAVLILGGVETRRSRSPKSGSLSSLPDHQGNQESGDLLDDFSGNEDALCSVSMSAEDSDFSHWIQRSVVEGGDERIEGGVSASFAAGQKRTIAHVAFVPPLSERPRVECHLLDDVAVVLKVAAIYPYGLRIELRRSESILEAQAVRISFSATTSAIQREAA